MELSIHEYSLITTFLLKMTYIYPMRSSIIMGCGAEYMRVTNTMVHLSLSPENRFSYCGNWIDTINYVDEHDNELVTCPFCHQYYEET